MVAKKIIPWIVAFVAGLFIGNEKGKTKGEKKGYDKASKAYAEKFQHMEDRFKDYKRKRN